MIGFEHQRLLASSQRLLEPPQPLKNHCAIEPGVGIGRDLRQSPGRNRQAPRHSNCNPLSALPRLLSAAALCGSSRSRGSDRQALHRIASAEHRARRDWQARRHDLGCRERAVKTCQRLVHAIEIDKCGATIVERVGMAWIDCQSTRIGRKRLVGRPRLRSTLPRWLSVSAEPGASFSA